MKRQKVVRFLAIFLFISLISCQGNNRQPDDTPRQQQSIPLSPPSQGLVSHAGQLPDIIDFEGQFLQAAQWPGQGSVYYAVVSKYEQGILNAPSWASRLNIYLFEVSREQIISRRAFQAEAPDVSSSVNLTGERSRLISLPSMGDAFSIVYSICPGSGGPCSAYSSVIGTDGKYDFQIKEDVDPSVYREAQQAMMAGIPEDVRQHMLEQLFEGKE